MPSLTTLPRRLALLLSLVVLLPAALATSSAVATPCNPDDIDCEDPGDNIPPNTTLNGGPANGGMTNDATPTFTFTASEGGSTFECKVDAGAWGACTSPKTTPALSQGSHTFRVRASDDDGNTDASPALRTFTVDTTDPTVAYTGGGLANGARTNDTTPTFTMSATDTHATTLQCKIGGAAYAPCSSPWTAPAQNNGAHTAYVKATDEAGNESAVATRTFTIDTVAPAAQVTGNPGLTNDNTPTFAYSATHDGGGNYTFLCKVDGGAPVACNGAQSSGSYTPGVLADGPHTFAVKATDSTGNAQANFVTAQFTVDTEAPLADITAGPADGSTIAPGQAEFQFGSSDGSASLQCQLDGGGFQPCTSPYTTPALGVGPHAFQVRAIDGAGNVSPLAERTFTVANPPAPVNNTPTGGTPTPAGGSAQPATTGGKSTAGGSASSRGSSSAGGDSSSSNASRVLGGTAAKKKAARKCRRVVRKLKSGKKVRKTVCTKKKAKKARKARKAKRRG